jgi:hypothetical protein
MFVCGESSYVEKREAKPGFLVLKKLELVRYLVNYET